MKTKLLSASDDDIRYAGEILRRGGLVGMPTETVYGLAGNALRGDCVRKIYQAKGRPSDNPLIVHISSFSQWEPLVAEIPEKAKKLAEKFWPGPLTIILKKSELIPKETSGGLDTVAVRMPSDETARRLIESAGVPLAAPSANTSGKPSPTSAQHVMNDLCGKIDAVIDGGECQVGVESTVISLVTEKPRLLRPGGVTPEMLESVLGEIEIDDAVFSKLEDGVKAASPGMKYKHYSPSARVILLKGTFENYKKYIEEHKSEKTIALCFDGEENELSVPCLPYGAENDSLSQAHLIFSRLREADEMGADTVFARYPERSGVGLAVYNRLIRAAAFEVVEI
ncbi:MAG: L-threonylcarbamoyladenylate synthase [Acutalibacteraceae bacterium]